MQTNINIGFILEPFDHYAAYCYNHVSYDKENKDETPNELCENTGRGECECCQLNCSVYECACEYICVSGWVPSMHVLSVDVG